MINGPYHDGWYIGFLRSTSGSIFSYDGYIGWRINNPNVGSIIGPASYNQRHPSRAVIVVGSGI